MNLIGVRDVSVDDKSVMSTYRAEGTSKNAGNPAKYEGYAEKVFR